MKPAPFELHTPTTLAEAVGLLRDLGSDAAPLAGGQSLLPEMNLRAARPRHLVDLNRLLGLGEIDTNDGCIRIGALVRHRELETSPPEMPARDLLVTAAHHVGHPPIRARGTFVGSLAHADPAAEWCVIAALLEGEVVLRSAEGERTVAVSEFFTGPFSSTRRPDELLIEARLHPLPATYRTAFVEESWTKGDLPLVCVAAAVDVQDDRIADARIAAGGIAATALRVDVAERALHGAEISDGEAIRSAARRSARLADPLEVPYGSPEYKRHLGTVLIERAVLEAVTPGR
jgi:aerobic carbon-monoxide dehydrogenase medium subunit